MSRADSAPGTSFEHSELSIITPGRTVQRAANPGANSGQEQQTPFQALALPEQVSQ